MNIAPKKFPLVAAAMIAFAAPVAAPVAAQPSDAAATPTIDSSIEALMANEATKAVVLKHLPGMDQHPSYSQFKGMTLKELQPWSGGVITDAIIENITKDLAALG